MTTNMRRERQKENWTLGYVADIVGITKQSIYDIETSKTKPSYGVLLKLLALFGRERAKQEVEQLFSASPPPHLEN